MCCGSFLVTMKAFILKPFLRKKHLLGAIHMNSPAGWAGSPRRDGFYPTFIWNLLSHFNQKDCFNQAGFKRFLGICYKNSDLKP